MMAQTFENAVRARRRRAQDERRRDAASHAGFANSSKIRHFVRPFGFSLGARRSRDRRFRL
jgi:hypothetical protein